MRTYYSIRSSSIYNWGYGKKTGSFEEALKYYTSWKSLSDFESNVLKQPFNNLNINGLSVFKVSDKIITQLKDGSFTEVASLSDFIKLAAPYGEIKTMGMNKEKPDRDYFKQYPEDIPAEYGSLYNEDKYSNKGSNTTSPGYRREEARTLARGNKWQTENFYATQGRR